MGRERDQGPAGEPDTGPARYEPVPPLPRPWERRAGLDRRPDDDRSAGEAPPRWLPGRLGRRVAAARSAARETRERTAGGARIVREVAEGVRDEAERVARDAEERARATATVVGERRGRPTVLVAAALVLVACTYLLVTADAWAPSAGGRGVLAWLVAVVGLGLAAGRPDASVTGTFRAMLLPAAALAILAPLSRAENPFAWAMLAVPLMGVGGAVLVGATAGVARRAAEGFPAVDAVRRLPAASGVLRRLPPASVVVPRLAVAASTLAAMIAAWGVHLDRRVVDVTPDRPVTLSDRTGAFRGVEVGDRLRSVRARLGAPVVAADGADAGRPLDAPADLAGPPQLPTGDTWRYEGLALVVSRSRVLAAVITDERAQTAAGVGIGDSIEVARRAYAGLTCEGVRLGEAKNAAYPSCRSRLPGREGRRRVGIALYGDPVQSVVLTRDATGPLLERAAR